MNFSFLTLSLFLGLRHGVDPDHLAAIDGLARVRNSRWNGVLFALGHGLVVTLLAAGIGNRSLGWLQQLSPWLLLAIGTVNLYRLFSGSSKNSAHRMLTSSPILLGVVFAAGFETASQLAALALASQRNALLLGATFSIGMIIVDGIDGYNAAMVQRRADCEPIRGQQASRYLSYLVILTSYSLAAVEFAKLDIDRFGLPIGSTLFVAVLGLRIWSRASARRGRLSEPQV
jgi:high-affinity nickel-transport protein